MLSMGSTRRLTVVLVAGLLFSFLGAAVIKKNEKFQESPLLAASTPATVTTTTAPATPETTAAPVARAAAFGPPRHAAQGLLCR